MSEVKKYYCCPEGEQLDMMVCPECTETSLAYSAAMTPVRQHAKGFGEMSEVKKYLGDGVYVDWEPHYGLKLTTENGVEVTNKILLEPAVLEALINWLCAHGFVEGYMK